MEQKGKTLLHTELSVLCRVTVSQQGLEEKQLSLSKYESSQDEDSGRARGGSSGRHLVGH